MSEKSVSQTSSLIVHKVNVDGIATPLRALVDTEDNDCPVGKWVDCEDAEGVVRLAIECEDFRGEDEFILLDLDDKFDVILGMPWLKRYQPSIDWMNMKISVGKLRDADLCCTTTDEVAWVYTSVEEIPDVPCDIAVCDGPPCSQVVPILKTTNGGGAVRRQKKTVSFAIDDEKIRDGVDKSEWKWNRHPSQDKKKKTSKRSVSSRVLSTPDQGTSGDDEGSVQAQDTPSEFMNIAVYNEEGDVDVIRHVKIENPPSSVQELISLPSMSKKTLERSLARGDIAQNTEERFEEQSWDALKKNPVYALAREFEDIFPDKVPDELPFDRGIRHEIDTPVPRKDMILDGMVGSTVFSAIDLKDGFCQIRMREDDVPLTAVSTPSGMLWDVSWCHEDLKEWLLRYLQSNGHEHVSSAFAVDISPSYFADIFVLAFEEVKRGLREAPVLALPNHDKPFHVVCDASDYAIGCALMQHDDEGHERVVSYQSRQLRPAERNCPVHDKELLAMKYSLVKFRVYLLGEEHFAIYTDHASLRKDEHLSRCAVKTVRITSPKTKSEGTDGACQLCEDVQTIAVQATTTVREEIVEGYKSDETCQDLLKYFKDPSDKALQGLPSRTRSRVHHFRPGCDSNDEGLCGSSTLVMSTMTVLRWPSRLGYASNVRTCEICQRVNPLVHAGTTSFIGCPIGHLEVCDYGFHILLPDDTHGRKAILVVCGRFIKMVHLAAVFRTRISAEEDCHVFVDVVFRLHGLPVEIVSDRDTRFTSKFWRSDFWTPKRVNRVLEDVLRSYATSFKEWSEFLPLAEFALNNSTHVSTGHTPFYVNYGLHPRVPASIMGEVSTLSGGGTTAHGNKPKSSYDLNAAVRVESNF
ncbi:Pol protein, partial [Globisporangium splendens]